MEFNAELSTCLVIRTSHNMILIILTLSKNLILLSLMFSGLQRYRDMDTNGLWQFISHQVCSVHVYADGDLTCRTGAIMTHSRHRHRAPHNSATPYSVVSGCDLLNRPCQ